MTIPVVDSAVAAHEELRRAVRPQDIDPDTQKPTSVAFKTKDMSVDVGSLATLQESRARWPFRHCAITLCQWFLDVGHIPVHKPEPQNISHAEVPGKLNDRAKRIANRVETVYDPITALRG